jgi:ABC-2 type transport system ATP-binding protein
MNPIIEARGLTKRFGRVEALARLDLVVEPGQVVALLGPNGAGKTTFVRTVATLVAPDGGTLSVAGFDVARQPGEVRRLIGLAGQYAAVEEAMTGRENLEMIARLYGQNRPTTKASAVAVLERMGLTGDADRLVRTYSGGMRRRLDLGASLVGAPRLLLLDEPTTGLDPRSRLELWDAIRSLSEQGTDVLLTTQYLDEADRLADRIVIIDHGRVIADGTPRHLKARSGRDVIEVHTPDASDLPAATRALSRLGEGEPVVEVATRRVSLSVDAGHDLLIRVVRSLDELRVPVEDVHLRRPTLDEVFLSLTGASIEAPAPAISGTPRAPGSSRRRRGAA